jgi:hypothetical protein
VAGLAVERGVEAVQREAGLAPVVEALRLEVAEVAVETRVLDVATRAVVSRHGTVDASFLPDAVGHGLVAREASRRRHLVARLVAALAFFDALELRVGPGQLAGRDERAEALAGGRAREEEGRESRERREAARRHQLPA